MSSDTRLNFMSLFTNVFTFIPALIDSFTGSLQVQDRSRYLVCEPIFLFSQIFGSQIQYEWFIQESNWFGSQVQITDSFIYSQRFSS